MKKVSVWLYREHYEALSKLADASWSRGISTIIREIVQKYLETHPAHSPQGNENSSTPTMHPPHGNPPQKQ